MKILISAFTGLGNFILKTPVIAELKKLYPDCRIDCITGNDFGLEFILQGSNFIRKTHILKEDSSFFEKYVFFLRLRRENYDVLLLPFDANRSFLFFGSYISGIKKRLVHVHLENKVKTLFFLCSPGTIAVPLLQGRHEIDLNYDLLEKYLNIPIDRQYSTFVGNVKSKGVLEKFSLRKKKYITLQIGAANGVKSAKKWPRSSFAQLIERINSEYKEYIVVTVGDYGDYINDIKKLNNRGLSFKNLAGLTTIEEVISVLSCSKLVVANDSGIMHIANALNCELVALYGPTDYTRTRPLGVNSKVLFSKTECFCKMYNFSGNEVELLDIYPDCMNGITVQDVMKEVDRALS